MAAGGEIDVDLRLLTLSAEQQAFLHLPAITAAPAPADWRRQVEAAFDAPLAKASLSPLQLGTILATSRL